MVTRRGRMAPPAAPSLTAHGVTKLRGARLSSPVCVQLLSLYRFILDPAWLAAAREEERSECADGYDLILSDGGHTLKVSLSTRLNELVYSGQLVPLGLIRVSACRLIEDPLSICQSDVKAVLITGVEVVRAPAPAKLAFPPAVGEGEATLVQPLVLEAPHIASRQRGLTPAVSGPVPAEADGKLRRIYEAQTTALPLLGQRGHYVKLASDEVFFSARWLKASDADEEERREFAREMFNEAMGNARQSATPYFLSINAIAHQRDAMETERTRPLGRPVLRKFAEAPLIGRVVAKGAVLHFGDVSEPRPAAFPTCFSLWIADSTSEIKVTLWNRLCETYYAAVSEGDVIMVQGHRLRRCSSMKGGHVVEAMLNAKNPEGKLAILDHGQTQQIERCVTHTLTQRQVVPPADMQLLRTRWSNLGHGHAMLDDDAVDVRAVVATVLPAYRHRLAPRGTRTFVRFIRARWLLLLLRDQGEDGNSSSIEQVPILLDERHCGPPLSRPAEATDELGSLEPRPAAGFFDAVKPLDFVEFKRVRICRGGGGALFLATVDQTHATRGDESRWPDELTDFLLESPEADSRTLAPVDRWTAPPTTPVGGGGAPLAELFPRLPPLRAVVRGPEDSADDVSSDGGNEVCDPLLRRTIVLSPAANIMEMYAGEMKQILVKGTLEGAQV